MKGYINRAITVLTMSSLVLLTTVGCQVRFHFPSSKENDMGNDVGYAIMDLKTKTLEETVDTTEITKLDVDVDFSQGVINLDAAEDEVINVTQSFNIRRLEHTMSLTGNKNKTLRIKPLYHISSISFNPANKNTLNVKVPKDVLTDFSFDLGAGKSELNFADLKVNSLEVAVGAGPANINLTSDYTESIDLDVDGGVGQSNVYLTGNFKEEIEADVETGVGGAIIDARGSFPKGMELNVDGGVGGIEIYLPADHGIRIKGQKGIGSLIIENGKQNVSLASNQVYENDAYALTDAKLDLQLEAGVGSIKLIIEE